MIDISNEVLTKLKQTLECPILRSYEEVSKEFPCVRFQDIVNSAHLGTIDSSGETAANVSFQVDIFTTGNKKLTESKKIRDTVNLVMSDYYGMTRTESTEIPNYEDSNIFRYTLRYACVVTKDKKIYRR